MPTLKRTVQLPEEVRNRLLRNKLRRANRRRHRPCPTCGQTPIVCSHCARLWCVDCNPDQCPWPHAEPTRTQVPSVSMPINGKEKPVRQRRATDEAPIIRIPPAFQEWADSISASGAVVRKLTPDPERPGRWFVEVFVPRTSSLTKPNAANGWEGHHVYALTTGIPATKGVVHTATLGEGE